MNFVSCLTAASTPSPSTIQGPLPCNALRRHQLFHWLQYTFCVLPPTEASARVSTSLSASFSSPPSPTLVPARRGLRSVHDCAFRVIAPHTMPSMYSVGKSGCRIVTKISQPLLPIVCSLHSPCTSVCRLRAIFSFGHLEIPSAATFCTPGICFAS